MYKSYKAEINPTENQKEKIQKTINTCRYVYNFFIEENSNRYKQGLSYMNAKQFSVWMNNEYLPNNKEKSWIKEVSSKSVRQSLENANIAFQNFFKKKAKYPRFKKKSKQDVSMYFVKTDAKSFIDCERHRIKIPTLGWVKLKEKGYIPTLKQGYIIKSGNVSIKAGRYYVSVLIEVPAPIIKQDFTEGMGIDLGLKDFAILSNGKVYKNINKSKSIKDLEKRLKREQRRLSRKYQNHKKGESTKNIDKQILKVQKLYQRLSNTRSDYINKVINKIARTKPSYITIEDLNVKGMMKNRHLSKAIQQQKFSEFMSKLKVKCMLNGIELRQVDRFYPSSKLCHNCGCLKTDLKLSDRVFKCDCGYIEDRDFNASLNLRDAVTYKIVV